MLLSAYFLSNPSPFIVCSWLWVTRWLLLSKFEWCNPCQYFPDLNFVTLVESIWNMRVWLRVKPTKADAGQKFGCVPKILLTCLLLRQFALETFEVPPPFTSQSLPKESGATETILQIFLLPPSSAVPSALQFLSSWHLWRDTKVKIAGYQPTIEITS